MVFPYTGAGMRKCGFTIIELLVVIAVIALLTAILVPSLLAVRNRARTMLCSSNQRQLSLAFIVYQQEKGVFPYGFNDNGLGSTMAAPPEGYSGSSVDKKGWWWFNYLQGSVETKSKRGSILWCPSRSFADRRIKSNVLCENYGVNRSICVDALGIINGPFSGKAMRLEQIQKPAGTMLISDSGYSLLSWQAAVSVVGAPFENPGRVDFFYIPGLQLNQTRSELAAKPDAIRGRHPNRMLNLGFADGHNELRPAEFIGLEQSSDYPSSLWAP